MTEQEENNGDLAQLADRVTAARLKYKETWAKAVRGMCPFELLEKARRELDEAEEAYMHYAWRNPK